MPRPGNATNLPAGESVRSQAELRETVLLSEGPGPSAPATESAAPPPAMAHQLSSQAIAVLAQRYDIVGEAGHGSMGSVYKARDRETGEIVALKLLKPEIASDQVMMDRFKNELLFARKITHKNVCRVYEFNRISGIAYTSMEFVEGESLRSVLNRFGGLPVKKALDVAQQICSGLQEAHAQGIVHRDLKPENVMIDAQGNIKIMDFGIARSMEAGTRLTGSMVGTPAYMAPEQVAGKPVDYRTDVYSLGLILYEIFTGTPAFQAENAVAVALKQMRESPAPPHEIEPAIPVAVERAIVRCIEKEPVKRFQSVAELNNALKRSANAPFEARTAAISALHQSRQRASVASHPLYGSSAFSTARPKRTSSPLLWVLLIAVVGGAAYAGWRQPELRQAVQQLIVEVKPAPPKPPEAASTHPSDAPVDMGTSNAQPSATSRPHSNRAAAPAAQSPSADGTETAADTHTTEVSAQPTNGTASVPAAKLATHAASPSAETAAEQAPSGDSAPSAAPAAPKSASKPAMDDGPLTIPPVNDHVPSYVWVGRYEREDRARDASRKISDLGLPVAVVPRHALTGQVYIVISGPFGPDRVTSVVDWLKTQGFFGVHPLNTVPVRGRQMSNQPAASEP
jgi:serine/threonine protein kinase